jgi:hypothetical protein
MRRIVACEGLQPCTKLSIGVPVMIQLEHANLVADRGVCTTTSESAAARKAIYLVSACQLQTSRLDNTIGVSAGNNTSSILSALDFYTMYRHYDVR